MNDSYDYGLEVLLKKLHMKGLKADEELLKKCFEIQKKYQYETERNHPLVLTKKLIENEVEKRYEKSKKGGKDDSE